MPKLPIINSLRKRWKRSILSDTLKAGPILNLKEGESIIVTYTSAADKMKIFSAFIREGLENGDSVDYFYPDEESETVRAKLREHGINVEKYEKDDTLFMISLTENFMSNGKLDCEKAVNAGLNRWAEACMQHEFFGRVKGTPAYGGHAYHGHTYRGSLVRHVAVERAIGFVSVPTSLTHRIVGCDLLYKLSRIPINVAFGLNMNFPVGDVFRYVGYWFLRGELPERKPLEAGYVMKKLRNTFS